MVWRLLLEFTPRLIHRATLTMQKVYHKLEGLRRKNFVNHFVTTYGKNITKYSGSSIIASHDNCTLTIFAPLSYPPRRYPSKFIKI